MQKQHFQVEYWYVCKDSMVHYPDIHVNSFFFLLMHILRWAEVEIGIVVF